MFAVTSNDNAVDMLMTTPEDANNDDPDAPFGFVHAKPLELERGDYAEHARDANNAAQLGSPEAAVVRNVIPEHEEDDSE